MTLQFSDACERVFALAKQEAKAMRSGNISSGHILLALMLEGRGLAALILENLGFRAGASSCVLGDLMAKNEFPIPGSMILWSPGADDLPWSPGAVTITKVAPAIAARLGHRICRTEHLLLAAMSDIQSPALCASDIILAAFEVSPRQVMKKILDFFGFDEEVCANFIELVRNSRKTLMD